jgi:hypothetical protein
MQTGGNNYQSEDGLLCEQVGFADAGCKTYTANGTFTHTSVPAHRSVIESILGMRIIDANRQLRSESPGQPHFSC